MKPWTLPAIASGLILLISLLFVLPNKQQTTIIPQKETSPATTLAKLNLVNLAIKPDQLSLRRGEKTTLSINIEAKEEVSAVELHLKFDPAILKVDSLSPSTFFAKANILQKDIDNKTGQVLLIVGGLPAKSGSGQLLEIKIGALKVGQSELAIEQTSQAAVVGKSTNALGEVNDTTITVSKNE